MEQCKVGRAERKVKRDGMCSRAKWGEEGKER